MIAFWSAVAALTVVALVFMILPLARKVKSGAALPARAEFDITVYKDQLTEVDRDLERGVLSEDQALAARTEIERRMLAAGQDQDSALEVAATSKPQTSMALIGAIVVAVPLGAVAFYMYLGQPELRDQPLAQRQQTQDVAQAEGQDGDTRARAMELVAQLEGRLKENPKDIEGWLILAQVYEAMNRFTVAADAYEKVVNLTDRHPEPLTAWAEALIMAEQTVVTEQAANLLKEIKSKDPSEPRTYFYLALQRQQHDDLHGAMDEYVELLKVSPSDAEWVPQIQDRMTALAGEIGIDVPVVALLPPAAASAGLPTGPGEFASSGPTAPGPTAEQMQDAQQMTPEDRQAMIQEMVQRLADRLKDNPDDLAGWQRLAQVYRVQGETAKAAEADAQVARLQARTAAPAAPGPTMEQMQDAQQMSADDRQAMIQSMVQRLADKLKDNPDDLAGWQRLAQAYRVMGDMAKVAEAEAQIKRLQAQ